MRILLTGASGFIGRATAEVLRSTGHQVVGLVHSSPATSDVAEAVCATLGSDDAIEAILAQCAPCDAIVHAAAHIDYDNSSRRLIRVNCLGIQQIIAIAEQWRVRVFVNTSSVPVVGRPSKHPITEGHPAAPRTAYHATKLFGEHLLASVSTAGFAGVSLRVSAPVGTGMPAARVLPVFVRRAIENRPLLLSGNGARRQNYVDVRDVADGILGCLDRRPTGVFNLGGPSTISNLELARTCVRVLASSSTIEFSGEPDAADDEVWDVSSEAARAAFHYQPKHTIESSIKAVALEYDRCID